MFWGFPAFIPKNIKGENIVVVDTDHAGIIGTTWRINLFDWNKDFISVSCDSDNIDREKACRYFGALVKRFCLDKLKEFGVIDQSLYEKNIKDVQNLIANYKEGDHEKHKKTSRLYSNYVLGEWFSKIYHLGKNERRVYSGDNNTTTCYSRLSSLPACCFFNSTSITELKCKELNHDDIVANNKVVPQNS